MRNRFSPQELQAEEWITRAHDDELNVRSILKHRDGTPNAACFLSQQMTEKLLKAYLVSKKKWYPKIHPLDKLLELAAKIDPALKKLKSSAVFLNTFYVPTRYPGDYPEFSWEDAEEAFKMASRVKKFILEKLKG